MVYNVSNREWLKVNRFFQQPASNFTLKIKARSMKFTKSAIVASALAITLSSALRLDADEKKDIVETAVSAGSFNTLAAALTAADLVKALQGEGPFTVFAPTDAAFAKLPAGTVESLLKPENKSQLVAILKYHVVVGNVLAEDVAKLRHAITLNGQRVSINVEDGKVRVDSALVTATDIGCSNGTIHVIDQVILPASDDIPATAIKAGKFKTLVAAAKAAGLVEALSGNGPLTVFAPTDDAFAKLPQRTVASLLKPENKDQLTAILKHHVISGRVYSDAALKEGHAKSLLGSKLKIAASKSGAMVNEAKLVKTDIDASNGVIHVIDTVMMPPKGKVKVTAADAKKMIEAAMAKGTALYNSGHHAACAQVYHTTMTRMVGYADQMPPLAMQHLNSAMSQVEHSQCATSRAWTLRHGLNGAYSVLCK